MLKLKKRPETGVELALVVLISLAADAAICSRQSAKQINKKSAPALTWSELEIANDAIWCHLCLLELLRDTAKCSLPPTLTPTQWPANSNWSDEKKGPARSCGRRPQIVLDRVRIPLGS